MIRINGLPINTTRFPDNTSQVWKLPLKEYGPEVNIEWTYTNEAEILELAQLKLLLNCNGKSCNLDIKYLPYARQDKWVDNDATFALRSFAAILNNLNFGTISIQDPHSEVALELIRNSWAYYPEDEVKAVFKETKADLICYPDKGAATKYSPMYEHAYVTADKKRDQLTGHILGTKLNGDVKGKSVLIVDDICDGGATFIFLAQKLLAEGAKEVNLFVTHGLFTKGLRPLKDAGITNCYTPSGVVKQSYFQKGV